METTPSTSKQSKELTFERFAKKVIDTLGSLQLAMFLLFTIALSIGIATFMESKFTTEVARYYIYRAPWFTVWLIVLCLNLFFAALTRWPWKRRHLGFVITHAGIITLLIGAMIGRWNGFEAFITLHKGELPQNRLISQETILTVQSARDGGVDRLPFPVEVNQPSAKRPRLLALPDTTTRLRVDDYTDHLAEVGQLISSSDPAAPPGVSFHFSTAAMKQNLDVNLFMEPPSARRFDFFTLARVELVKDLAAAAVEDQKDQRAQASAPFQETQVVFAAHPDQPVIDSELKEPSNYQITITKNGANLDLNVKTPLGAEQTWALSTLLGKTFSVKGDTTKLTLFNYWPDFVIQDGKPTSLSKEPRNPAVLVQLSGVQSALQPPQQKPLFRIAIDAGRHLNYQLFRAGKIYAQGRLATGDTLSLGWADWQGRVEQVFPHSELRREFRPLAASQTSAMMEDQGIPAIHARLIGADGKEGESRWIMSGTSQILPLQNQSIRVGFGLKPIFLPFSISLEKFTVPRDEGTETPSDFISSLRFEDNQGNLHRDEAHMNYPAMYPGQFWRSLVGWNYKFSQSSWNPNDLDETSLQVLYDPGWPAKWIGSIMICCGIAIMFYLKPRTVHKNPVPKSATTDSSNGQEAPYEIDLPT